MEPSLLENSEAVGKKRKFNEVEEAAAETRECRLIANLDEADALLVFVHNSKIEKEVPVFLPKDGKALTLGRPHAPNGLDHFLGICEDSNRKISRKLASLRRVHGSRRLMLTRHRNTVTSIFVDGINYKPGEPAFLESDYSALRFGATANKDHEVHLFLALPVRSSTLYPTVFRIPKEVITADFALPSSCNYQKCIIPNLKQLAARAAINYEPLLKTRKLRLDFAVYDNAFEAATTISKLMPRHESQSAETAWIRAKRDCLATEIRCQHIQAEARTRYIINCGHEPSSSDLEKVCNFQRRLESGQLYKSLETSKNDRKAELDIIHCPSCGSHLIPGAHRKHTHFPSKHKILVELVCEMNHDCALRGLPFIGIGLRLCHSAEMRLVLGDGCPRRLASKAGEVPSGFYESERDIYKPGNCATVFIDTLTTHDDTFFSSRRCKSCPAHFNALFCYDCIDTRPRRREGLFCCNPHCASGPVCCLDPDRYLSFLSSKITHHSSHQNSHTPKPSTQSITHHTQPSPETPTPLNLADTAATTPTKTTPYATLEDYTYSEEQPESSSIPFLPQLETTQSAPASTTTPTNSHKHRRPFPSPHSVRTKAERLSLLGPCGLCGMLYCRRCLHQSRVCCKTCYYAADCDASASDEEADY